MPGFTTKTQFFMFKKKNYQVKLMHSLYFLESAFLLYLLPKNITKVSQHDGFCSQLTNF